MVNIEGLTPDREPLKLPPPNPGPNTLFNEFGLKFSDATDERDEEPSHGTIGGDVLSPGNKLDPKAVQFIHDREKVLRAPGKPVEGRDDDHCEFPLPGISQHSVEAGATSLIAGDAHVGIFDGYLIPALLCEQAKVVKLVVHSLV
jgi:hypothetical protein